MNNVEIAARVRHLIENMTLEEKAAQMVQVPCNMVSWEEALEWARRGAGSFLHVLGEKARALQKEARASRMGIPVLFGIDAVRGHALNEHATIFPTQLAMACSFDPEMVEQIGRDTACEVAADGLHWTFSPILCLGRDLRWGRVDETFGEDTYLTGELGQAIIKGYQGGDLSARDSILACAKHYIAYGEAVGGRDSCDSEVSFRKIREVFLPPFEKAVQSGCQTFMTAYGSLDGTPCTASEKLLKTILRDEMGFDGFVVTDWDNVDGLIKRQYVCETTEDASALAANAGNDMMMTTLGFYDGALKAVRSGKLKESVLDKAVEHILTVKMRLGLFENPEKGGDASQIGSPSHRETALQAARESVVLLKNDDMLPLEAGKTKKLALIGANADDLLAQYGDWTYFSHPNRRLNHPGVRPYVTLKEGLQALAGQNGFEVTYDKGCPIVNSENDAECMAAALSDAANADAVIYCVGDRFEQVGENKDRADLALSGRQTELYRQLLALHKPICVVLLSSKPLCLEEMAQSANALVVAFNGGMYAGQAIAEVLTGAVNPSGKLPVSFPRHVGQLPVYYNALPGWHGGRYEDLAAGALYSFGQGLSYTFFQLSGLKFNVKTMRCTVKISNTGKRAGASVVQIYFSDPVSSVMTPGRQLAAFKRVMLQAGESKALLFQMRREDFSLVLPDERRVTEPGRFILTASANGPDDENALHAEFRLE